MYTTCPGNVFALHINPSRWQKCVYCLGIFVQHLFFGFWYITVIQIVTDWAPLTLCVVQKPRGQDALNKTWPIWTENLLKHMTVISTFTWHALLLWRENDVSTHWWSFIWFCVGIRNPREIIFGSWGSFRQLLSINHNLIELYRVWCLSQQMCCQTKFVLMFYLGDEIYHEYVKLHLTRYFLRK